ncbi:MAG: insulinase family protein, partial [Flavobacteriales bacterium]|nr:insulinase family protein [Flavobacteriales bacterium]
NNILGGSGFQTRLMQNLREDKGFTYGAYSSLSPDELVSSFSAGASVRNEVTDSAVVEFLYEMKRMVDELVPDSSLQTVKNIMSGSFARSLERPQTIANFALNIEKYKLPKDYYETYLEKLNATTAVQVQGVATKFIRPNNVNITVVGNKEVAPKLDRFARSGKAELMQADGSKIVDMKPAPEGVTAQTVLNNYLAAIGGVAILSKVKGYEQTGEMKAMGMSMPMKVKMKGQKMMLTTISMQGMEVMKQVCDGSNVAVYQMGQKAPIDESDMIDVKMQADMTAEAHLDRYGLTPVLLGIEQLNGEEVYVIEVRTKDDVKSTDYYSVKSGLKVKSVSTREMEGTVMTTETTIKDYMTTSKGIKFPSSITQVAGGQTMEIITTAVNFKPKFGKTDFVVN